MISRIRHVGIVVKSLDESLKFYRDTLGLSMYRRYIEPPGEFIDRLVGRENVRLEWAKMIIPEGGLIELVQYHSHSGTNANERSDSADSNKIGSSHVSLTVDDLSKTFDELSKSGYKCNSEPLLSPDGKVKILYCYDSDGFILELIEDLRRK